LFALCLSAEAGGSRNSKRLLQHSLQ